jgi:hypothetical protein
MRNRALLNKILILLVVLLAAYYGLLPQDQQKTGESVTQQSNGSSNTQLEQAVRQRASDLQMQVSGHVLRVLSDDREGSRHQRFILETAAGRTLLVAHNIDLAPRVEGIDVGDPVEVYGEYEWNDRGGVIHWTHKDPRGNHVHGWVRHRGRQYD